MIIRENVQLAPLTSFGVGGSAKYFVEIDSIKDVESLDFSNFDKYWIIGDGTNVLISDQGLDGALVKISDQSIEITDNKLKAHAGASWDAIVQKSIEAKLWGIELMSGIPGSVGAAVSGNIAAYGQAVSSTLESIEVYDVKHGRIGRIPANELRLDYRYSNFHTPEFDHLIILSATFALSDQPTQELKYQSALNVAYDLELDPNDLNQRREIIMTARGNAGSLLDDEPSSNLRSAGSFFKNPLVAEDIAEQIMSYDESGVSKSQIKAQNREHGGNNLRVSAAHVLLAAGFKRGQTWGQVQLHPEHILKIVNLGSAKSQDIYNVAQEIITTVKSSLGVELEPEVKFLGDFSS